MRIGSSSLLAAAASASLVTIVPARADASPRTSNANVVTTAPNVDWSNWYGWQVLGTAAIADGIMLGAIAKQPDVLPAANRDAFAAGMGLYAFGPAAIHALHGYGGRALGSLLLDSAAATTVSLATRSAPFASDCGVARSGAGCADKMPVPAVAVLMFLPLLDMARSWDGPERTPQRRTGFDLAVPTLAVERDGARLGVGGAF